MLRIATTNMKQEGWITRIVNLVEHSRKQLVTSSVIVQRYRIKKTDSRVGLQEEDKLYLPLEEFHMVMEIRIKVLI